MLNVLGVVLAAGTALLVIGCDEAGPSRTGRISVTSAPSGASIFLDGIDTGQTTPYTIFEVSAGFHAIRLTLDGHTDWGPRGVSVTVGETATVHATLERTNQPPGPVTPSEDLGLGLKRMDVEAYQSAHILRADPVALPASVDLSVDAPLPRSQGRQGSCVGWAVAFAVKTYHERIERGWPLTDERHVMSPAYVYNQVRVPGGGAYFVDAFNVLIEQGVSSWALMPYDPSDNRSQPSAAARAEAADYKIADWGAVQRTTHAVFVQEVKRHLAAGDPVLIGVPVYPDFHSLSESNPVYDDASGAVSGAHAIVIVGYDDARSAFKIINSWGTDWGIGGYGWIDYDASDSLIWEAYVLEDVVASPADERPAAPTDPTPGAAAEGVAVDTVLRWTRNARTTSFDVYVGTDRELSAVDFQGNVAREAFTPHLAPGSRYYWRVDARGAGGVTRGPVWSFTTAGATELPGKVVNPSPADGASGVARDTVLSWDSGGHTTSYDVYFGTSSAPELRRTQAGRTFSPGALAADTRYYWRVDARGAGGVTRGPVWSFTTEGATELPGKAVNPSPADGASGVARDTVLSWDSGGHTTSYDVYFGTSSAPELRRTQAGRTFSPGALAADTRYYWRVDARGAGGVTRGPVWSFTTEGATELPGKAVNPSPADGASGVARDTVLSWDSGGHTTSYDVYFGTSSAPELRRTQAGRTFSPGALAADTRYYWRIDARGAGGVTTGSVWSFTTVGGVQPQSEPGTTWRTVTFIDDYPYFLDDVAWGGSRFVAVGYGNGHDGRGQAVYYSAILYSPDGISWTVAERYVSYSAAAGGNRLRAVAWNGTRFVAVGHEEGYGGMYGKIVHSSDGTTWTEIPGGTQRPYLLDVVWDGVQFLAYGGGGIYYHSPDGITWTAVTWTWTIQRSYWRARAAWNGERFVRLERGAVNNGTHQSTDGIIWKYVLIDDVDLEDIVWNGARFVAVGETDDPLGDDEPLILHSLDGMTWTPADILADNYTPGTLTGIAWNGAQFVAVGLSGYHSSGDPSKIYSKILVSP